MRLLFLLLLLFPSMVSSDPKKFHCLNGTSEESTQILCRESQGCQTEIILPKDESEEYKLILGCNERLSCGNVKTSTGFVVCCTTSLCNKGYKFLDDDLTAEEAAEALAIQAEGNKLPRELPKPIVNPIDEETEEEKTTTDPSESSGSSGGFIGYIVLWIILILV